MYYYISWSRCLCRGQLVRSDARRIHDFPRDSNISATSTITVTTPTPQATPSHYLYHCRLRQRSTCVSITLLLINSPQHQVTSCVLRIDTWISSTRSVCMYIRIYVGNRKKEMNKALFHTVHAHSFLLERSSSDVQLKARARAKWFFSFGTYKKHRISKQCKIIAIVQEDEIFLYVWKTSGRSFQLAHISRCVLHFGPSSTFFLLPLRILHHRIRYENVNYKPCPIYLYDVYNINNNSDIYF